MEFVDGETARWQAQVTTHLRVSGGDAESTKSPAGSPDTDLSRAILESAPVSLIVVDPSGHIIGGNSATVALFGTERLDGHMLTSFVEAEDRLRAVEFVTQVRSGQTSTLRYWLVDARGDRRAVETRGVPVRQHDGSTLVLGATWEVASSLAAPETQRGILVALAEAGRGALEVAYHALTGRRARRIPTREPRAVAIEHDRLKGRVADLEDSGNDYAAQRTRLEAYLAELARAAEAHATERNQWQAQIADLQAAADTQTSERNRVEGRVAELVATVDAAAAERERLERRIADLEGGANDHTAQRTQLEARVAELARAGDAQATERSQLLVQIGDLQAAADTQTSERERLERRIAGLEAGAAEQTTQRTQLEARLAELARAGDAHATERNQLQGRSPICRPRRTRRRANGNESRLGWPNW